MAIWLCTLCNAVLGELPAAPRLEAPGREVPLSQGQLLEGVEMLTQIGQQTALVLGPTHLGVVRGAVSLLSPEPVFHVPGRRHQQLPERHHGCSQRRCARLAARRHGRR